MTHWLDKTGPYLTDSLFSWRLHLNIQKWKSATHRRESNCYRSPWTKAVSAFPKLGGSISRHRPWPDASHTAWPECVIQPNHAANARRNPRHLWRNACPWRTYRSHLSHEWRQSGTSAPAATHVSPGNTKTGTRVCLVKGHMQLTAMPFHRYSLQNTKYGKIFNL